MYRHVPVFLSVSTSTGATHSASLLLLRDMVGDQDLQRAHTTVFTLMASASTAPHIAHLPPPAAVDAVGALLADAKQQYQSVTSILEVSRDLCPLQVPKFTLWRACQPVTGDA